MRDLFPGSLHPEGPEFLFQEAYHRGLAANMRVFGKGVREWSGGSAKGVRNERHLLD